MLDESKNVRFLFVFGINYFLNSLKNRLQFSCQGVELKRLPIGFISDALEGLK